MGLNWLSNTNFQRSVKLSIIFCCQEMSLLSYFAVEAYLHQSRKPSYEEIMTVIEEKYTIMNKPAAGELIRLTNNTYLLEVKKYYEIVRKALIGYNKIFTNDCKIVFLNLNKYENYLIKTGYFLKKLRLNYLSKKIITYGLKYSAAELLKQSWKLET
ncbi:DUF3189 family protein [Halocella sp. SP3-1]|nr:DUF3189 family protein [Halocella sp. SP3-1]